MLVDNNKCFACGTENPGGLHLSFSYSPDGSSARTTFIPDMQYQGWEGVVHGGILMTLLDEVMAKTAARKGFHVLTAEMTAKFKHPARVLEPLCCEGRIEEVKKKIIYATATIAAEDGSIVAQGRSKYFILEKHAKRKCT